MQKIHSLLVVVEADITNKLCIFCNNIASLENREWIWVTATIKYEFQMAYKKKGPVLYVESVEKTGAPKEEMVFF